MLAAIFDPYLDTLGGGERYTLTFAEYLQSLGHDIDLFWDDPSILSKAETKFGINLGRVNILPNIFIHRNSLGTGSFLRTYDLFFAVSDGSIPFMTSKKNILHFQVPFQNVRGNRLVNKLKFHTIHNVICNSHFTKRFVDIEYGINSSVVYPPVATSQFKMGKKKNIILSVGRFSNLLQSKRHDVLIENFRSLVDQGLSGWELIIAGGSEVGRTSELEALISRAAGYPIEIVENPTFGRLQELYAQSKIFWFASGYGINDTQTPQKAEHFGISVVEAMSAGCVPIVHPRGGVAEIISDSAYGLFWRDESELQALTLHLISTPSQQKILSTAAILRSREFSVDKFHTRLSKII